MRVLAATLLALILLPSLVLGAGSIPSDPAYFGFTPSTEISSGIAPATAAAAASKVVKTSKGLLYGTYVTTNTTPGYFIGVDATANPADGAVTALFCVYAPANSSVSIGYGGRPPIPFQTGLVIIFSSTGCASKTDSIALFLSADAK